MSIDKQIETMYLDWINNFLTIPAFSAHYGISEKYAIDLLEFAKLHL